ncbi:MAG: hypothetical protein UHM08_04955 [Bacteroidales bacterium]|nr:hypothetical protein [Bacteroidales bacterium]
MERNNLCVIRVPDFGEKEIENKSSLEDLSLIANRSIENLNKEKNILIFPDILNKYKDDIDKGYICKLQEKQIICEDILGFIGVNNTLLNIHSRFAKEDEQDYFMHYMLEKVFKINLVNLKYTISKESIFDFLLYLFPYFLNKALRQGVFKQYISNQYNDTNVRGVIDVSRHIKHNIPFNGKIAYNVREYCFDNHITQLIRHTIEYLRHSKFSSILNADNYTKDNVSLICNITPKYNINDRNSVISKNLKPLAHPYYTDYKPLQKLCIQILSHKKIKYGESENNNKVYGLLFRGSWLWEEFLYETILKECGFKHPKNKEGKDAIYLFKNNKKHPRFPDYMKDDLKDDFILDAKYKHKFDRNDIHQIITYMYIKQAIKGGFIHPCPESQNTLINNIGELSGYGGNILNIGIPIPQSNNTYPEFVCNIQNVFNILKEEIKNI